MYRLFLALRYLRSRLVNLISVGGVMFGVAVLIVVTSVMDGFQMKVREVLRGNLSDIIMVPTTSDVPPFEEMEQRLLSENRKVVAAVSPQFSALVFYPWSSMRRNQLRAGDRALFPMTAVGVDWEKERAVSRMGEYLVATRDRDRPFFSAHAQERDNSPTVIVSRTFAEYYLGLGKDPFPFPKDLMDATMELVMLRVKDKNGVAPQVGQSFEARPDVIRFVITGVYDAEDTSVDVSRIFVDRRTLRQLAGVTEDYQELRVRIQDPEQRDAVKASFIGKYSGFDVETWEDQRRQYLRAVNSEKVLLVIVLSFIVLLGGFIILATLTLTVVEKTKDIGVLGALGASRSGILSMFVGNGFLIGVIGSLLGVLLGWLFASNINLVKDFFDARGVHLFPADIYLFREVPTVWSWGTVAWIAGGSILISFLAGLIPAWRAARLDPVKALRYE